MGDLYAASGIMDGFTGPWFICGGWALDLHLAVKTRPHRDVDLGVFRHQQFELQKHLAGWRLSTVKDGRDQPWKNGEMLNLPQHEIRAVQRGQSLEILLNESVDNQWVYRRDRSIRHSHPILWSASIPYLAPEIVLLYKSKSPRPQDELDFQLGHSTLDRRARQWLAEALAASDTGHPWLSHLK